MTLFRRDDAGPQSFGFGPMRLCLLLGQLVARARFFEYQNDHADRDVQLQHCRGKKSGDSPIPEQRKIWKSCEVNSPKEKSDRQERCPKKSPAVTQTKETPGIQSAGETE